MASSLEVSGHLRSHSPQSYRYSGNGCISELSHLSQKAVYCHDLCPSALCEGDLVRVFSRSSGKWVQGKITKIEDDSHVRVEYDFKDDTYGKNMHVDSDHLIIACQLVESDLTSNEDQCDLRVPTSEVAHQPEHRGKSCPNALHADSRGFLTPSEFDYSEQDPEIGFFDIFKNPFRSGGGVMDVCGDAAHKQQPDGKPIVKQHRHVLPRVDNSYEWVQRFTGDSAVKLRKKAANDTRKVCSKSGYILEPFGDHVELSCDTMMANTRTVKGTPGRHPDSVDYCQCPIYYHGSVDVLNLVQFKRQVALVIAASAKTAGGEFTTGGKHDLEESLCMQTTLFESLKKERDSSEYECYIPIDGAVLSPNVEVFRGGWSLGYPFLPRPFELSAVVSIAMPNRNANCRKVPHDSLTNDEYRGCLDIKMNAMLNAVGQSGARVLFLPELGSEEYQNDKKEVGYALGRALRRSLLSATVIREVHVVGSKTFKDGVLTGGQWPHYLEDTKLEPDGQTGQIAIVRKIPIRMHDSACADHRLQLPGVFSRNNYIE